MDGCFFSPPPGACGRLPLAVCGVRNRSAAVRGQRSALLGPSAHISASMSTFGPLSRVPATSGRVQASTRGVYARPASAASVSAAKPPRPTTAGASAASSLTTASQARRVPQDIKPTRSHLETTTDLDLASAKVSSFLSDSRVFAERISTQCSNSGCAFLCTGLAPKHCCKMCAKSPGSHGPKCQKKLLPCATPGCTYAVTGLTAKHCCKMCASFREHGDDWWGPSHGAQCWCLPAICAPAEDDEQTSREDSEKAKAGPPPPPLAGDVALEVPVEESSPETAAAAAAAAAVATAAAEAAEAASEALDGDSKGSSPSHTAKAATTAHETQEQAAGGNEEVSPEELQELELAVKSNEDAIKTNEAVIQALLAALS